jgi:hypothetical protein
MTTMNASATRPSRTLWSPPRHGAGQAVIDIAPELAAHLLSYNTHNRPIRRLVVDTLTRDFANGLYIYNGEPIRFDTNCTLIDGQHRLHAIVASGVPVQMMVVWGLQPKAQEVTDIGAPRKFSDNLTLSGIPNAVTLGATLRMLFVWSDETGLDYRTNIKASQQELRIVLDKYPDAMASLEYANGNKQLANMMPRSALAFSHLMLTRIDRDDAEAFFESLTTAENLPGNSPILQGRRALEMAAGRAFTSSVRRSKEVAVGLVFKAWNMYRARETCTILSLRSNEKFPIPV